MRSASFFFASLILLALVGCAGYKLGPTNGEPAHSKSIQVKPFVNETLEPRLSDYVSSSLRKRLQQDGTFQLDTHQQGDIVVTGVITEFNRGELSFQPNDVLTPRDYRLSMVARITAVDRNTGKTNLNRTVSGRTTIRVGNDLSSSERQAIPLLSDDLARNAVSLLADGTW
jgi:hypothetical protein